MEPLAQPDDHPTENPGKPKRRRRWWLLILFLILATLTVLAILTFANPAKQQYGFLFTAKTLRSTEHISSVPSLPPVLVQSASYYFEDTVPELALKMGEELIPLGWKREAGPQRGFSYYSPSSNTFFLVQDMGTFRRVLFMDSRPPNAFDYARVWINDRIRPKPQLRTVFPITPP